jgi:hypothetical protein
MTEYINNGIIRINAILKEDDSTRISITTNSTPINNPRADNSRQT